MIRFFCKLVTLRFFSLFLLLSSLILLQYPASAQGAQGSKANPAPAEQAKPQKSKAEEGKNSPSDLAVLTREYAPVNSSRPMLVEPAVEIPKTSFIREWYRVEWRAGDPFYLYVIRPKGVAKPPVILYLPSFPEDTELFKNNAWCDIATSGGYAVVGFIGNVTGHRARYRLLKEWFVSEMPEALTSTTHDVQMILDYLSSRGDLDMYRVGMFGAGSGGAIAVLASTVDPRIQVLDLMAPWGDWKTWIAGTAVIPGTERATFAKPEFENRVAPLDPVLWLPKVQAKSIRMENIRGNKAMPDQAQERLESAAPDSTVINQYGNGRAFITSHPAITTLDWMKSQLAPDAKPAKAMEQSARTHFFPAVEAAMPGNMEKLLPPQSAKAGAASDSSKDKQTPQ